MEDPAEHALVVKAIVDGLGNCFYWDEKSAKLVIEQCGLHPRHIRQETIRYVRKKTAAALLINGTNIATAGKITSGSTIG